MLFKNEKEKDRNRSNRILYKTALSLVYMLACYYTCYNQFYNVQTARLIVTDSGEETHQTGNKRDNVPGTTRKQLYLELQRSWEYSKLGREVSSIYIHLFTVANITEMPYRNPFTTLSVQAFDRASEGYVIRRKGEYQHRWSSPRSNSTTFTFAYWEPRGSDISNRDRYQALPATCHSVQRSFGYSAGAGIHGGTGFACYNLRAW